MSSILQDIWFIKENSGIVLLHREYNKDFQPQLFGGLMSALNSFAKGLDEDGLSSFELDDKKYCFKKCDGIISIASTSKDEDDKKVNSKLERLLNLFLKRYSKEFFKSWDGNIEAFSEFQEKIKEETETQVKQFWNGF
ncbi:MAG: hypothetical protein BAJALOKI2v1_620016 [Promethearchaeota archaeon]|nr:MAG: hypothetical protein BAJALOKI2v1_620016 [Candidatus Lokiarchaeota archaeon]